MPNPLSTVKTRAKRSMTMTSLDIEGVRSALSELISANHNEVKSWIQAIEQKIEQKLSALENALNANNTQIDNLEKRLAGAEEKIVSQTQRNVQLASQLNKNQEDFEVKIDDIEQYGRKSSLRIEGIKVTPDETNDQLKDSVLAELNTMGANITKSDIWRLHRSGKPHRDRDTGELVAQSIVKFASWDSRQRAYRAKGYSKANNLKVHVKLDLTKRRLTLLSRARSALGKKHPYAHCYPDQDCNLVIKNRATNKNYNFNTRIELENALCEVEYDAPQLMPESDSPADLTTTTEEPATPAG